MNIGIDSSRSLEKKRTGTENYSYQITLSIARQLKHDEKLILFSRPGQEFGPEFAQPNIDKKIVPYSRLWTQFGLAQQTWQNNLDLLFIPAHVVPLAKNIKLPVVVTVHDIRTEFLPQHSSWLQKLYLNQLMEKLRAKLAHHIIAVSESTKNDLINLLNVPAEKITVIYEGYDPGKFNLDINKDKNQINLVKEKYKIEGDYMFFVGTIQPRKNLFRLIQAFSLYQKNDNRKINLVLAGKPGWMYEQIYQAPRQYGVEVSVNFINYVDDDDLPYLYAGAELFVYPSLYEGFGLPILESMAVGTPVLTSNIASMPEVGGEAAYYIDPLSVESIYEGIKSGFNKGIDHQKAQVQLDKFSWDKAGKETLELFRKIVS